MKYEEGEAFLWCVLCIFFFHVQFDFFGTVFFSLWLLFGINHFVVVEINFFFKTHTS